MKNLDNRTKMEIVTGLLVFDEMNVWYDNDNKKFIVTPDAMLVNQKQNREFIGKYHQKDFFKDSKERKELEEAYHIAIRPLYAKTFDF